MKKWFDVRPYGLALLLLTASPLTALYAQYPGQSLFTDASDVKSLNPLQQQNYDILAANPNAAYIKLVRFDLLSKVQDNGVVSINLPFLPCTKMQYRAKQVNFTSDDNYEWYGEIISNNDADTTCSDGFLTMVHMADSGELIGTLKMRNFDAEIQDLSGGIKAFVVMDQSKLGEGHCGNGTAKESTTLGDPVPNGPYTPQGPNSPVVIGGEDCVKKDVKVLVLYTPGAKEAVTFSNIGTLNNIYLDAAESIFQTNVTLSNSEIPYQVSLAGVAELPGYVEKKDAITENTSIATYPPAQVLRDQYHADVIMLMTKPDYFDDDIWGNTRNVGSYNLNAPNLLDKGFAYSVVDVHHSHADNTFQHEIGHIFGGRHDLGRHDPEHSYLDPKARAHKFKRYWIGIGGMAKYRTTITYSNGLEPFTTLIPYYSNVNVTYRGVATGKTEENNSQQMIQHIPLIGSFYTEPAGLVNSFDVQFIPYPANSGGIKSPCSNYAKLTAQTNGCTLERNYTHYWQISTDGINWVDAGTGNTIVLNPTNPNILVKLKTVAGGSFSATATYQHTLLFNCPNVMVPLSATKQMECIELNTAIVYPNPNTGNFILKYNVDNDQDAEVVLMDVNGKMMESLYKGSISKGQHQLSINTNHKYPVGVYFLKIIGRNVNYQTKITFQ